MPECVPLFVAPFSRGACTALSRNSRGASTAAKSVTLVLVLVLATVARANETWDYKKQFLPALTSAVPKLLKDQNKETGAFGTEPWIVTDQNPIFPLAAAWAIEDADNPWFHKTEVLDAV